MYKAIRTFAIVVLATFQVHALSLQTVFDNQKKAAFPDTCEMQMRTTVTLPGQTAQVVNMALLTAGVNKSITTIKSSMMQMEVVQNNGRMKVTDLKTGKKLPTQNMPAQNPADVNKQMGSPEDYNNPIAEGSLWKIMPKDASKPTLYYSQKNKRVMKMEVTVNGASSISEFEYCDNSCELPGTLKKVTIKTAVPQGGGSTVIIEVLKAKQRHVLPMKMFDVK
ncbi:hypothetical protein SAMN05720766_1392 [Fibrobacter sp. UWH9]|uniref:hypothetical protein n=1 Tax=unclassified Fibrobacter TaxID=2634177 RepID=UPI00091B3835|nr:MULTISPECIES: hypothetical protein [unclassified Fibrobacter]OWV01426.1 hypothetical protein B7993_15650 [Fibrobacter sp. UWH3]SHH91880.1 hypothetical protein SAMN05720766_1392 [Fibrobacter sp. UWH9]SHL88584.1 hypothetical protein SAMN05720765_1342 [Fibrobacter sp. UWH6]